MEDLPKCQISTLLEKTNKKKQRNSVVIIFS